MKTTPYVNLMLRIAPALKRALECAAKADHRSVNSLVEHALTKLYLAAPFKPTGRFSRPRTGTTSDERESPARTTLREQQAKRRTP